MTEQEANERVCLLNGLFNADLNGYDFLTTSETAALSSFRFSMSKSTVIFLL